MEEIGSNRIDTLILSLPEKIFNHEELDKDLIMPLWSVLQKHVQNKSVISTGLSDFNASYLEQLMKFLEDKNVIKLISLLNISNKTVVLICSRYLIIKQMPTINQVNLTSCCKMPEDLGKMGVFIL